MSNFIGKTLSLYDLEERRFEHYFNLNKYKEKQMFEDLQMPFGIELFNVILKITSSRRKIMIYEVKKRKKKKKKKRRIKKNQRRINIGRRKEEHHHLKRKRKSNKTGVDAAAGIKNLGVCFGRSNSQLMNDNFL